MVWKLLWKCSLLSFGHHQWKDRSEGWYLPCGFIMQSLCNAGLKVKSRLKVLGYSKTSSICSTSQTSVIQSVVGLTEQRPLYRGARWVKFYISSAVATLALLQGVSMPVEQLSAYLAMVNKNSDHWQYYTTTPPPPTPPSSLNRKASVVVSDQCVFFCPHVNQ